MASNHITEAGVHVLNPSTFETIDAALLNWVDNILNINVSSNDGWKKVPIIWMTAERAFQIKNKKEIRSDDSSALVFPLISIERAAVVKTPAAKRPIPAHIYPVNDHKKGVLTIAKRINQNKTRNFANADTLKSSIGQENFPRKNEKIVYQTLTIPLPIYYDISYNINLRTDYQQQMNEMMAPFAVYAGNINQFKIEKAGHAYEAFIDDSYTIANNISSLGEEEKKYETTVKIKVLGFLIGSEKNQDEPKVSIRENVVQIRFPRERVLVGDINEINPKEGFRP